MASERQIVRHLDYSSKGIRDDAIGLIIEDILLRLSSFSGDEDIQVDLSKNFLTERGVSHIVHCLDQTSTRV